MRPYIVILAAAISFSASALQIGDFFQNAEVIKANSVKVVNESLIRVSTTIKGYAANAPYAVKTIDVPKPTFMSHVKTNMKGLVKKNAWYAAWLGTMAAAGWAVDELTGQMVSTSSDLNLDPKSIFASCFLGGSVGSTDYSILQPPITLGTCSSAAAANKVKFKPTSSIACQNTQGGICYIKGEYTLTFPNGSSMQMPTYLQLHKDPQYPPVAIPNVPTPVPDTALYDSLAAQMLKDPIAAAQAFMVPDAWPYPYPHIFPDPIKYIPGVSESDQELLDALIKGQLQTTNPGAANYVTPEKLQQLQTMLSQLQQGLTPEGQAGIANDNLKQPITQAQLEETLKKQKEAEAKADQEAATKAQQDLAPADGALDKMAEEKTWLETTIKEAANQAPPSSAPIFPQWVWPVGNCKPFPITFTISNLSAKADDKGAFCRNYNDVYHPLIYWFLYMLFGLYLFVLWNKTMVQVLGSR